MSKSNLAIIEEPAHRAFIRQAVELKGSQAKLGDAMGCSQQAIWYLLHEAESISGELALACDIATAGAVSKHDLRPDLFGPKPNRGQ